MVELSAFMCQSLPVQLTLVLLTLAMTYALVKYHWELEDTDTLFTVATIGVASIMIGQATDFVHGAYHLFEPIMYSPSMRVMTQIFTLGGYVLLAWSVQRYFKQLGDIE